MALIKATCTQCSGQLELKDDVKTGFCLHCGTKFISEDVINNYNTNNITNIGTIQNAVIDAKGKSADDYALKAKELLDKYSWDKSVEEDSTVMALLNKALTMESDNAIAQKTLDKVRQLNESNSPENIEKRWVAAEQAKEKRFAEIAKAYEDERLKNIYGDNKFLQKLHEADSEEIENRMLYARKRRKRKKKIFWFAKVPIALIILAGIGVSIYFALR